MPMPTPQDFLGPQLPSGIPEPPENSRAGLYLASTRGEQSKVQSILDRSLLDHISFQELLDHALSGAVSTGAPNGHPELVRYLISRGAHVHSMIPVMAVGSRSPAVFQVLLENGWDVNSNNSGEGPLLPRVVLQEELLHWFLEHGADPSARLNYRPFSSTALDSAAAFGTIDLVKLLLQHGASLSNSTPLQSAAMSPLEDADRIPMLEYLLGLTSLDINAGDKDIVGIHYQVGPPINAALKKPHMQRVRWLLGRGAVPNIGAIHQGRRLKRYQGMEEPLKALEEARREMGLEDVPEYDL